MLVGILTVNGEDIILEVLYIHNTCIHVFLNVSIYIHSYMCSIGYIYITLYVIRDEK